MLWVFAWNFIVGWRVEFAVEFNFFCGFFKYKIQFYTRTIYSAFMEKRIAGIIEWNLKLFYIFALSQNINKQWNNFNSVLSWLQLQSTTASLKNTKNCQTKEIAQNEIKIKHLEIVSRCCLQIPTFKNSKNSTWTIITEIKNEILFVCFQDKIP